MRTAGAAGAAAAAKARWRAADAAAVRPELAAVAAWLFVCCAMIFIMVVIGGITRLTLSGLSITDWQPVTGIVPPLSAADWTTEFAKYQHIPQYKLINTGMSLADFRTIYWWEYVHRLWGRLISVVYALPFLYFLLRRRLPPRLIAPLAGILLLGFGQGLLGWYMVESGLAHRVEVSQYRLVAHLALALAIYAAILWVALGILGQSAFRREKRPRLGDGLLPWPAAFAAATDKGFARIGAVRRRASELLILLVALTIGAGGFTAGLHAGLTYNTFPLMDGRLVPAGYAQLRPFWRNWFENVAAVQFDHRLLAMTTLTAIVVLWAAAMRAVLPRPARLALWALLAAAVLQVSLGISTLLLVVPIALAVCHQAGAVLLLTATIVFRHTLRPGR
jgi:heme a synthase